MDVLTRLRVASTALTLAVVLGTGALVIGPLAGSAYADRPGVCEFISTADSTKGARAVFTGTPQTATRMAKPSDERGTYFLHEVSVSRVYRGAVDSDTVAVRTEQTPRECSLGKLELGTEYVFFVVEGGDPWVARSGAGTTVADAETIAKVERLLGEGRAPVPPAPETAEFTPVDSEGTETLSQAAAPGLGLVLAGLLGLLVVRAAGNRSRQR